MAYVPKTQRFGLLTPSSNTTQEPEFTAALPPEDEVLAAIRTMIQKGTS